LCRNDKEIGNGKWKGNHLISQEQIQGTQEITVLNLLCMTNIAGAIDFIYPERFNKSNKLPAD